MDPILCIHEHFDLIFNSNINVKHNKYIYIFSFKEFLVNARWNSIVMNLSHSK